jgi:hypothetical protein
MRFSMKYKQHHIKSQQDQEEYRRSIATGVRHKVLDLVPLDMNVIRELRAARKLNRKG